MYEIPGGMLCTICGLRYYNQSMGGLGICPACDCGNSGPQLVAQQSKEIAQLRGNLSLAEEGLANYAQEVERLTAALQKWDRNCACGCSACEELYTLSRGLPPPQPAPQNEG